jgi:phosphate acetyltransferase/phosphate butyryltransferase
MTAQPPTHPRLSALVERARERVRGRDAPRIGLVYPCDALALDAAQRIAGAGFAHPVLIGPRALIEAAADAARVNSRAFEVIDTAPAATDAALQATLLVRSGALAALMKGSLHTDELMSAIVNRATGLRTAARISHAFLFDLPRYHKLLALADCVVNIAPDLKTKHDILGNAVRLLQVLGIPQPQVAIVTAVETVNPAIPATLDAQALVQAAVAGAWPGAMVEGPFGFDNAFSAEAARIKKMHSQVAGDADLMLMPDLNAGNMLYKSFNYVGGGDCAGLVLGATVPIVLTSRADSLQSRIASVALAVLAAG